MIGKVRRLLGMSALEIAHRGRERIRRRADRARYLAGAATDQDRELDAVIHRQGGSLKGYFHDGPARRFYPAVQDREGVREFMSQRRPDWRAAAIREADVICDHRISLLGYRDIALGPNLDWRRDPVTGFMWPSAFCADCDLVESPPADAKIVHELNRHQHLPRLAKAFFLTGNERYASEAVAQLETWMDQNPKWCGVNWESSLEIAIRSISWLWTLFLILDSEALQEEQLRRVCRSLFAQLDQVYRYPSVYTSPNTHLIGEAAALFIAGVLFPELPRAGAWREFGARMLTREMERQVSASGVYGELSSYYHCYAADFYLQALALARLNHIDYAEWVWRRLSQMLEFVMHLTRPDGAIPLWGDDDGGRALAIASDSYSSYRDGLSSGAVLFGRGDFKHQSKAFCEETMWLLGADACVLFDSLPAHAPAEAGVFEDAGYIILHGGSATYRSHVVFDCGGMGLGSGGHAHADALSLTIFSGGQDLIIDPGTSVYNGAPPWRRFFRSAEAHNVVLVDGGGPASPGGTFKWNSKAAAKLLQRISVAEMEYVAGTVHFRNGVAHRRRLVFIRPSYWLVLDDLHGTGEHDFEFLYHFAPEALLTVAPDAANASIDCRAAAGEAVMQLQMYGPPGMHAETICGSVDPIQGWCSRRYGERTASPVLKTSVRAAAPVAMMSVMALDREAESIRFRANSSHTIAAAIRTEDGADLAIMSVEDGDLRFTDYEMRGEFFLLRTENGSLRRLFAVNAYSFSYAGETVFDSRDKIPSIQAYFWENGIVIERGDSLSIREREQSWRGDL